MFPTDIDLSELVEESVVSDTPMDSHIHRSFLFDFETGQHIMADGSPKETTELQAIKQWLYLMCATALDKYPVYKGESFGTSAENFIGYRTLPYGFVASEIQREIEEAIALNPAISFADDFSISRGSRGMEIAFTAHLVNGELLEVNANV